jgi:uncharacterized Zn finger protein
MPSGIPRRLGFFVPEQLSSVLSEAIVKRLASPRSFARGAAYLDEGRVGPLRMDAGRVNATVQGSESYAVELRVSDGRLRFACSCPVGVEGEFCKHCVAVALSSLEDGGSSAPTLDDARIYLESLPPRSLVELLVDHAHDDERLARRLLLLTARSRERSPGDMDSLRVLIDQAFAFHEFVPYREVWGYVQGIEETVDALDEMLAEGHPREVIDLTEYALTAVEHSLEHVDDSDGQMGDLAARLQELHLEACRRGAPDPVELAERLFLRELEGDWDIFDRAAMTYANILGEVGLARYRELAHTRWANVPELAPGEGSRERYGSRFRITRIMETLAEQTGDLSVQIAVRERDLGSPYSFLQIAELCRSHNEHDMALEWAQRGTAEFPDSPDHRLRDFLVKEYRRRGSAADAIEHTGAAFNSRPALETYRELAIDAKALGEWDERRTAALTLLRASLTNPHADASRPPLRSRRDATELVRVLLWEDDPDAAWRAAIEGGCTNSLWLQLADQRRAEHPDDTLTVYRLHVEQTIAGKDKRSYAEAVRLIEETIRPLFTECGKPDDYEGYLEEIRSSHRPKRNLMKLMDQLKTRPKARA